MRKRIITYLLFLSVAAMAGTPEFFAGETVEQADSLYAEGNWAAALKGYVNAIENEQLLRDDFNLNFKIGYCLFREARFETSKRIFQSLKKQTDTLPEYIDYFLFAVAIRQHDSLAIDSLGNKFKTHYTDHFLIDSVYTQLADFYFDRHNYDFAYQHYKKLMGLKHKSRRSATILWKLAQTKLRQGKRDKAYKSMYQIMKKYGSSNEALQAANFLYGNTQVTNKYFFAAIEVYLKHHWLSVAQKRLEQFINDKGEEKEKEQARYFLLRVYFERGDYKSALYGFRSMLSQLQNKLLESRIRIYIARCLLKLDRKEDAARDYIAYADRFPRKRLAAETTWKAAWLYEETGRLEKSLHLYEKVSRRWPYSSFRKEAKFRQGLTLLRLGRYEEAEKVFDRIISSRWSDFQKHRAQYWKALVFDAAGKDSSADELLTKLGSHIFDDYYSLKAYLIKKTEIDARLNVNRRLANKDNPLEQYTEAISAVLKRFGRLFTIRELLGTETALNELQSKRYKASSMPEWVALAEVYKRLGAFNRAYRIYDYINYTYFGEQDILDKPFILKEQYPLYYDALLETYCRERRLDRNFILAIIREESSYNHRAHSWADAYGLMQIIPRTAQQLAQEANIKYSTVTDLFDAEYNINLGTLYVRKLLNRFMNRKEYVLAAYNAGPHRVNRWQNLQDDHEIDFFVENIEFSQTRNYVRRVMRNYWVYSILNGSADSTAAYKYESYE